jgi:small-conductance mechanosensitive channel
MDLQERRQLDMASTMTKVRARARPWRSIVALILAIAGGLAAEFSAVSYRTFSASAKQASGSPPVDHAAKIVWLCGLVAFFVFGMAAAIGLSARARSGLQPLVGQAHAGIVRYVLLLAGVFTVGTISLYLLGVKPDKLLVGGAITGVLLGIAAQQSLANLFAGLVLLFASPFRVGDHVRFRAGALSGEIEGVVTDLSLSYVRLETAQGQMLLPNAQALAAAVLLIPDQPTVVQDRPPVGAAGSAPPASGGADQSNPATSGPGPGKPSA